MSKIYLQCTDAPELKLGPKGEIRFRQGFAAIDPEQFPEWETWAKSQTLWRIENLGANEEGQVAPGTPDALTCEFCNKTFKNKGGLNGHKRTHAQKVLG